ncbi:FliM/FliN family flagellar motor C-terminal domain-containing protein [Trinickia fusca]|uniref:FliM/FliN family flagellar motor switch protein n=1 Tax=Trinickia fusca TaxID=2419777 RepID=A0A494XLJ4_9BURK|nr:FliM/FliN family flagellar motor C-terminal domain-containing protein [Trinickia fusca]RKP48423.1 FliM/FliN family flagellar motor switch protein [Trinickia fusca]
MTDDPALAMRRPAARRATLLSPDASARDARALRAWSDAERDSLARALALAVQRWAADWGVSRVPAHGVDAGVRCVAASEWARETNAAVHAAAPWHKLAAASGVGRLWWALEPASTTVPTRLQSARGMLLARLFGAAAAVGTAVGGDATSSMAAELADQAWTGCLRALAAALSFDAATLDAEPGAVRDPVPADALQPWSGSLVVMLPWCDAQLALLIDGECAARFFKVPPARAPLAGERTSAKPAATASVPVLQAVAAQRLTLDVALAPFDLGLGALSAMRVGDVLQTSHRLDAPLIVHTGNTADAGKRQTIAAAFLGQRDGQRAIELQRNADGSGHGNEPAARR